MASRTQTMLAALVAAIEAFSGLPDGVTVVATRNVTHLVNELPDDAVATLAVIVSDVEDESLRGEVADAVTVGIVLMANITVTDTVTAYAASNVWDEFTEDLRDFLRTNAALKTLDLGGGISGSRNKVETPVPCDGDMLNQDEVFVSVTTIRYTISVGNR